MSAVIDQGSDGVPVMSRGQQGRPRLRFRAARRRPEHGLPSAAGGRLPTTRTSWQVTCVDAT